MSQAESARHFYDRISGVYDALADGSEHEARELGLRLLAPSGSERVLEIGCGTGVALVEIAGRLADGGKVLGIDVSPGMLRVAGQRIRDAGLETRVELRLADAKELPCESGSMDAAFASFTLELFPREEISVVLAELLRVLRPGGRLGVVSMFDDGRPSAMVDFYRFLHRHFPHIVDCQPIDAAAWLERAGFEIRARDTLSLWGLSVLAAVGHRPAGGEAAAG
ncbi:MAG: methyltransferase domain-containing protein [Thermoanaerobaculia bacterium]|nr:methyltransferase domain-containing protein [Thermoanaerobaculia bacterium]